MKIAANEVHIWSTSLNDNGDQTAVLSSAEIVRAQRFYFPLHRMRFIAAHSFLRYALSKYLTISPADIEIAVDDQSKPYLPGQSLQFNLSHSDNLAALAITLNNPIGIDIELIKDTFDAAVAKRYYHPDEYAALNMQVPAMQPDFFYDIWSRKEALIKANGKGLSSGLNEFSTVSPNNPETILISNKKWYLYSLAIDPAYASALATMDRMLKLSYWQWEANEARLHQVVNY